MSQKHVVSQTKFVGDSIDIIINTYYSKIKDLTKIYCCLNSHMSIRSVELSILTVIGIGDEKYNLIKSKNTLINNAKIK